MKSKRAQEAEADETPVNGVTADAPAKKRKRSDDDGGKKTAKKTKKDKKSKKKGAADDDDNDAEKPKKQKREDKYKREKESRRERKERKKDLLNLPGDEEEAEGVNADEAKEEKPEAVNGEKKDKKEKKSKKEKKQKQAKEEDAGADESKTAEQQPETNGADAIDLDADAAEKQDRHIVFVGNLPYTATAASISAHFASLSPIAVRCLKNKGDDKPCRGIAFVEFGKVWHMRTCLDKFHHSMFNDGVSPARKINVELTAGGGGKTQHRQDKIRAKNEKLDENRTKRIEREKEAKVEAAGQQAQSSMEDSIHPSRRGRVPGMAY